MHTNKFLNELNIEPKQQYDNDQPIWKSPIKRFKLWKDKRKNIISYRDTWNFDDYMNKRLYVGLRRYVECADKFIILDCEEIKFEWQGQNYTQIEMINMILERIKIYYKVDDYLPEWNDNYKTIYDLPEDFYDEYRIKEEEGEQALREAWELWNIVRPACWW